MDTKALFLDLDDTLLNSRREITSGNRAAIEAALMAGHKVIITTGRPLPSALLQAEKLGLTGPGCYVIAFNGGMIYDMGAQELIYTEQLPHSLMKELIEEAHRRGLHVQSYNESYVLVDPFHDPACIKRYCNKILMEYRVVPSIADAVSGACKVLVIDLHDRAPIGAYMDWVNETYAGVLEAFFSCPEYVEVIPTGLGKGSALRRLAALLGLPIANTISAGDEENDLSMIRDAGVGCAMANAIPKVKAIADYITANDNNHDGVKEIIEKFML